MGRFEQVVLQLGSNMGDKRKHLRNALKFLKEMAIVEQEGAIYSSSAWGLEDQASFLNQIVLIRWNSDPFELLDRLQGIENKLGRIRNMTWGPRTIDIDILFFGNKIIKTKQLQIPHPHLEERNFVLLPLSKLINHYIHPISGQSIEEILASCPDKLNVTKLD